LEGFVTDGFLEVEGTTLRPTVAGMAIADAMARTLDVSTTDRR
jgi:hypothetical protein